jgi:hypothetical protein
MLQIRGVRKTRINPFAGHIWVAQQPTIGKHEWPTYSINSHRLLVLNPWSPNLKMGSQEPASKKRKIANDDNTQYTPAQNLLTSLQRTITPPPRSGTGTPANGHNLPHHWIPKPILIPGQDDEPTTEDELVPNKAVEDEELPDASPHEEARTLPSPVHLTRIHDLPDSSNVDTVGLHDLLGDPLIKECWNFNYLFDLNFVMQVISPA